MNTIAQGIIYGLLAVLAIVGLYVLTKPDRTTPAATEQVAEYDAGGGMGAVAPSPDAVPILFQTTEANSGMMTLIPGGARRDTRFTSTIYWRRGHSDSLRASPLSVLRATADRMQYEQSTPLGSDENARALVEVMRAIAALEGRPTETADGTPIIE